MARLNITLPNEIARKIANKHNKSRFIAIALEEKLEREKKEKSKKKGKGGRPWNSAFLRGDMKSIMGTAKKGGQVVRSNSS